MRNKTDLCSMPGSVREESFSHMRFVYLSASSLLFQLKVQQTRLMNMIKCLNIAVLNTIVLSLDISKNLKV